MAGNFTVKLTESECNGESCAADPCACEVQEKALTALADLVEIMRHLDEAAQLIR